MTALEMHIELDLLLRSVNSKRYNKLFDEEKDWLLNSSVLQFIKNRTNPLGNPNRKGFEVDTKRYDDLEELVTRPLLALPAYRYDANTMYAYLPYRNFRFINSISNITYSCDPLVTTQVPKETYYCVVPFVMADAGLYSGFKIEKTDLAAATTTLFDVTGTTFSAGLSAAEESFLIINYALEVMNTIPGIEARWENWNGAYYANSFIIVTNDPTTGLPVGNTSITTTYTSGAVVTPFSTLSLTGYTTPTTNIGSVENRLIRSADIDAVETNSFIRTSADSPTTFTERDILFVKHKTNFVINSVNIRYIRKPRKINLLLGRSCELNGRVHEEVVNLAAQRIKALLNAPDYKVLINENLNQE